MMKDIELLDRRVASAFYGRFAVLRPPQEAVIRPILSGENVVLSSSTGSGKTEAISAPLISRYYDDAVKTDGLVMMYIAPTKALVNDLEKRLRAPLDACGLRLGIRHGDRDDLVAGPTPHVLITTPESLDVLLFRKEPALQTVRTVVIDEVHLLYNTQRGLQLSILLRRLREWVGRDMQWAALSATVGSLQHTRDFLFDGNVEAALLQFPSQRPIDAVIRHCVDESSFLQIVQKLTEGNSIKLLVFANSRRECERLAGILHQDERLREFVLAHYSSLSPEVRVETERKFAASDTAICIATSTLELGIDIGDIDAVLLWDTPNSVESFLQRIGRGNRRAEKSNVVCLIPDYSKSVVSDTLRFLALLDAARKGELPVRAPYDLFGAVAQQAIDIISSEGGRFIRVADLCNLFSHKVHLDRSTVELILADLAENKYLQRHGFKNQYGADEKLHSLVDYRMIYGNFAIGSQLVKIWHGSKAMGDVPAINLMRIQSGDFVRFAGKRWRVQKTSSDSIFLQPSTAPGKAIDFMYPGGGVGFDGFLADRMWRIFQNEDFQLKELNATLRASLDRSRKILGRSSRLDQIPFIRNTEGIQYFTFSGHLVNKAIALITNQAEYEADDISLQAASPIEFNSIPGDPKDYHFVFDQLFEPSSHQSLFQTILPLELQRREYFQEWLKDESILAILARLRNSTTVRIEKNFLQ